MWVKVSFTLITYKTVKGVNMAIHFNGKQKCIKCGNEYEWSLIKSEEGEVIFGSYPFFKNVKNITSLNVPGLYSIVLECPKCYKREFVTKNQEQ